VVETANVVVAAGGELHFGPLALDIPPEALAFPSLEAEGEVGAVQVEPAALPFVVPGVVAAFALYPFGSGLTPPATVTVDLSLLGGLAGSECALLFNSTDLGGFEPLETLADGTLLSGSLGMLTWVAVASCN
jgi:hypothetical protein